MTEIITSDSVDPSVQIEWLQKRIAYLENLLQSNRIPFEGSISSQPAQSVLPTTITPGHARFFYSLFRGRQDVFSRRATLKNGNHAYFPVCDNLWVYGICPKKEGRKIKCADCTNRQWTPLTQRALMEHLMGNKTDGSDVIGMYPLFPDDTCRFLVFDFDDHANEQGERWKTDVAALRKICKQNEVPVLVERSRSGNGAHVWLFFEEAIPASLARKFGSALLTKGASSVNLQDFKTYDRMLPAQEHLPPGGLGNLIALPLQGQALRQGNSAFVDEHWNAYPNQW